MMTPPKGEPGSETEVERVRLSKAMRDDLELERIELRAEGVLLSRAQLIRNILHKHIVDWKGRKKGKKR